MWAEDEARLGLKPIARRVWALKGHRPRSNGQSKFESPYVFGFAHPATGRNRTLILPKANTATMTEALADFARWADPDGRKVLVLIIDNAGWHIAGKLAVPANVVRHHLPSCTPELQPVEPLWPLVREALANKVFPTLPALEVPLRNRLAWLADHPDTVKGVVGFHWATALGWLRINATWYHAARDAVVGQHPPVVGGAYRLPRSECANGPSSGNRRAAAKCNAPTTNRLSRVVPIDHSAGVQVVDRRQVPPPPPSSG